MLFSFMDLILLIFQEFTLLIQIYFNLIEQHLIKTKHVDYLAS